MSHHRDIHQAVAAAFAALDDAANWQVLSRLRQLSLQSLRAISAAWDSKLSQPRGPQAVGPLYDIVLENSLTHYEILGWMVELYSAEYAGLIATFQAELASVQWAPGELDPMQSALHTIGRIQQAPDAARQKVRTAIARYRALSPADEVAAFAVVCGHYHRKALAP